MPSLTFQHRRGSYSACQADTNGHSCLYSAAPGHSCLDVWQARREFSHPVSADNSWTPFSTARAPFWTSWTWNLSALIPMCCFTAARSEVTTGWRVLTARKRRRRKRNSGMSAPSYVVKVTFSAFVWFTCVCVCVLSPKRAENCKLSLEHQCYKRDTFKKQPWHGCLFPDDSQWHIHFLTNTWTKYLPPLELQRLAALCFLCRAP